MRKTPHIITGIILFILSSYDLEQINVTRKGINGYPTEGKGNTTDSSNKERDTKYDFIPGLLLPISLCILLCFFASVCLRPGTCYFNAWIK